ncbi:MAG: 3-deoxy-D-manno-octulosonic acid transferase [Deltaproteobacteria bacterium]|nr:3-deoxy-D-manno-octulosonic acid transferase [Deltaproteobacteria bacterium]
MGWPYFYWHLKSRGRGESFLPRLGVRLPPPPPPGSFRIWLHGVSVGEILAAVPLVQELKRLLPQASIIITTGTETGQAVARKNFAPLGALVCYFPLDIPWAVSRYLGHLRPQVFVTLESEIWPNFLTQAHEAGVRLALVNGRLSDKSFRRFVKYRRYIVDILNNIELFAAGSLQDFERYQALGLPPGRLHLTGNLKIDRLLQAREPEKAAEFRHLLQLDAVQPNQPPVFLAASTHPGEEDVVLETYQALRAPYPALLLLLAPRHPERAPELGRLLKQFHLPCHYLSRLKSGQETRGHSVVIIDTIGDLFSLYGLADAAFVGGSLVAHGGQNILEPAAWGLAPIYGPHLQNFRWAQTILEEARAGTMILDVPSLTAALRRLLDHPEERRAQGQRARDALTPHQGAARRQAELIAGLCG